MENVTNNEILIRQLVENWAKAVRDKDMDNILVYHADDIVMFDVPEPFESIGIDAYRKTWDIFFKYTEPGVFDIQQLTIIADENIAFCIATMKCADKSAGGDFIPLDFRLTIGLKKINDQWMIVHEHHSIPSN
jgi:ketosteroid isomerase-like protein